MAREEAQKGLGWEEIFDSVLDVVRFASSVMAVDVGDVGALAGVVGAGKSLALKLDGMLTSPELPPSLNIDEIQVSGGWWRRLGATEAARPALPAVKRPACCQLCACAHSCSLHAARAPLLAGLLQVATGLADLRTIKDKWKADGRFNNDATLDRLKTAMAADAWNALIANYTSLPMAATYRINLET